MHGMGKTVIRVVVAGVVAVFILSNLGVPHPGANVRLVPSAVAGPPVDLTDLIRTVVLAGDDKAQLPSELTDAIQVQETEVGRVVTVDMTAPGIPKGTPVIDISLLRNLNLDAVNIIAYRDEVDPSH